MGEGSASGPSKEVGSGGGKVKKLIKWIHKKGFHFWHTYKTKGWTTEESDGLAGIDGWSASKTVGHNKRWQRCSMCKAMRTVES